MELIEKYFDTAFTSEAGVKKLRELILTLAMQGKLVPQSPSDKPASELLKEIKTEKEKLIKEGKIKTQKELPPIKPEEIPYEIPETWEWVRLGEIGNIFNGNSIKKAEKEKKYYKQEGIPYIATKDVGYGLDEINYFNGVNIPHHSIKNFRVAHRNSVLICSEGGSAGRKCGITTKDICFGNKLYANEPLHGVSAKYILYCYLSNYFFKSFNQKKTGIIGGISIQKFIKLLLPLPPAEEQKRIVEKIDKLMAKCDEMEQLIKERQQKRISVHESAVHSLLSAENKASSESSWQFITSNFSELYSCKENVAELKKAILTLAMKGKLVPQDPSDKPASELLKEIKNEKEKLIKEGKIKKRKDLPPIKPEEIPYEIPDSWEWVRLGSLGNTQTGTTPPRKESNYFGTFIPFIGPGDISNKGINYNNQGLSESGLSKSRLIRKNSILMVCIGGSIGKTVINERDISCNQQINFISTFSSIMKFHLYYYLKSETFQEILIKKSTGSATPIINKSKWSEIPIPIPPLKEQKRIVEKIDKLMSICDQLEEAIDESEYKQNELLNSVMAMV